MGVRLMAKGRHLKPDFFTDKHIVSVPPLARLLYQGLWCYAHDCGHLDDEPVELKMRILPADSCDVEDLLAELVRYGRIVRQDGVIFLPKLNDHARVDKRYETFCDACKAQREHDGQAPKTRRAPGVNTKGAQRDHDADGDGDGDGDGEVMVKAAAATTAPKRGTQLPKNWKPTSDHEARALGAGLILVREIDKFRAHAEENGRLAKNWNAAFTRWLMNAEEYGRRDGRQTRPTSELPLASQLEEPPPGLDAREYDQWFRDQVAKQGSAQ